MSDEGSIKKNIRNKAIITVIALPAVWFISKALGFPILFRWMFAVYVIVIAVFFLLLDAPAMTRRKNGVLSIVITFFIGSVVYTIIGIGLPQYDPKIETEKIRKLTTGRLEIEKIESPQKLIEAGRDVYDLYECYNCHKLKGKGGAKSRGPELDEIGWENESYIKEALLDPMVWIPDEFDKPKLRDAMPDYYAEELNKGEFGAIVAYLRSLKAGGDKMPRGWWTDMRIIAEGKNIYDGITNTAVNCAACHGRDGKSIMSGARILMDANAKGSAKTNEKRRGPLKDWSDKDWFDAIKTGVPETAMFGWAESLSESDIWKVAAYTATLSGAKGMTQEKVKGYIETEKGKALTAYIKNEEERKERVDELEGEIGGGKE